MVLTASGVTPILFDEDATAADKVRALNAVLDDEIDTLLSSDGYKAYLDFASNLYQHTHGYSWSNTMLIWIQCEHATHVAGVNTWNKLGRHVKKGEKAIRIFAPMSIKVTTKNDQGEDEEGRIQRFKAASIFDISQTEGEPLPERPQPEPLIHDGDPRLEGYDLRLRQWLTAHGVTLRDDEDTSPAGGWYLPASKTISIHYAAQDLDALHTLIHESAHFRADHTGKDNRKDAETVAESATYLVTKTLGFNTDQFSFPYIAGWARDIKVFRANSTQAQNVAIDLLNVLTGDHT